MTRFTNVRPVARAAVALGCWAALALAAAAGEADIGVVTLRADAVRAGQGNTRTGVILNDNFDKITMQESVAGGQRRIEFPYNEVESIRYNVLGDAFQDALDALDQRGEPDACLAALVELEREVRAAHVRNVDLPLQHLLYLRARAQLAAAQAAAAPEARQNALRDADATLDALLKLPSSAWYFEATLLRQRILLETTPSRAAPAWTLIVEDFEKKVGQAPWTVRYVLGARLDQWLAQMDGFVQGPGKEGDVSAVLDRLSALEKEERWKTAATSVEEGRAIRLRLAAYAYLNRAEDLRREISKAIRQAQLDNNGGDLRDFYLMRADNAYDRMAKLAADAPEAAALAKAAFMDYLRVYLVYADQLGDDAPGVALKVAELYLRVKGPDWSDRALEMADAARRGAATRAAAEALIERIQAEAPKDAAPAPAPAAAPAAG